MAIRVAVDAMGGDDAPGVVIEGALRAAERAESRLQVQLYGPGDVLTEELERRGKPPYVTVVDAPEVIGMGDSPVRAVKAHRQSSIYQGLMGLKDGQADAFISAGNTGAVAAASLFVLGRLPGIFRPCLPSCFPTTDGFCIIVDVGSNMDSRAQHLLQFAIMGSAYMRIIADVATPRVGLLNVGEEPGKGNDATREAHKLLDDELALDFIGNIEGHDIMHHRADVVVCDGFVGNVVLKFAESVRSALPQMIRQGLGSAPSGTGPELEQLFTILAQRFNPEQYGGGSPLLGVDGPVFILHGRSSARSIEGCVRLAERAAKLNLTGAIRRALAP